MFAARATEPLPPARGNARLSPDLPTKTHTAAAIGVSAAALAARLTRYRKPSHRRGWFEIAVTVGPFVAICALAFWSTSAQSAVSFSFVCTLSTPAKSLTYPCGLRFLTCSALARGTYRRNRKNSDRAKDFVSRNKENIRCRLPQNHHLRLRLRQRQCQGGLGYNPN